MSIEFNCPGCARRLRLADENAGKRGKCPACQTQFDVPALSAPSPVTLPPPPQAAPPANDNWANFADSLQGQSPAPANYADTQNPFAAPRTTSFAPSERSSSAAEAYGTASIILGVVGLALNLLSGCCCLLGLGGVSLSALGLVFAFHARGQQRNTGLILNCVSLAVLLLWLVYIVAYAIWREM